MKALLKIIFVNDKLIKVMLLCTFKYSMLFVMRQHTRMHLFVFVFLLSLHFYSNHLGFVDGCTANCLLFFKTNIQHLII